MRATFTELAVGDLPALLVQAHGALTILIQAEAEKIGEHRAEILDLSQLQLFPGYYQACAVRVGDCAAIGAVQHHFGGGCQAVFGQGSGQIVEGQVSAHHRGFAALAGNGGADFLGGEEGIGRGGEVLLALQCAVVPGAAARVVGFLEVLPATDGLQLRIEEQVFGIQALFADAVDAPHLIFGTFGGKENLPQFLAAQRPHHKETAIAIADIN